jgi:hypothetical protein
MLLFFLIVQVENLAAVLPLKVTLVSVGLLVPLFQQ